jgi:hypothetical protein
VTVRKAIFMSGNRVRPIHPRKAVDFMGSSELPTVLNVYSAFGHPSQPGNSNMQNS